MQKIPNAVMLFAAGFGTRMRPLTDNQPKPMVNVSGKPLVDHILERTREVAPERIVMNLHYKPEPLVHHLDGQGITMVREEPDILDTGGGLRNALPALGNGPVWTANTDAIWDKPNPFRLLLEAWQPDKMDALLIAIDPALAIGHRGGDDFTMDADGRLSRGPGWIYGGVQIIQTDRLSDVDQQSFSLNVVWDMMLREGRLFGLPYPGKWCDVGRPESIAEAEKMIAARDV